MEKIKRAVLDTGPLIHLDETSEEKNHEIIEDIFIPAEVEEEFKRHRGKKLNIETNELGSKAKSYVSLLMQKHKIDLGEAEAIALAKQERINLFFTDDWYAREVANHLNIETHGTLALVLRAYRENMTNEKEALKTLEKLLRNSSLFITDKIINEAKEKVRKFESES